MIANFCTTLTVISKLHWLIFHYLLFFLSRINCCLLWSLAASFGQRLNFSTSSLCLKAIEFCTSALLDSYGQTACVFWKTERLNLETEHIWSNCMCFLKDRETKPRKWNYILEYMWLNNMCFFENRDTYYLT